MTIQTRSVEYDHQGVLLEGFLAWDDAAAKPLPCVMVSHAWVGRDSFACNKAIKLAELGYVGFALDMYGKGVLGSGPEENSKLMMPFMEDRLLLQGRIKAALETVSKLPEVDADKIAVMGFCFGGLCALDLARTGADIKGAVSFHGLLIPPGNTQKIKAKVLVLHGADDPMVSSDQFLDLQKELSAAGCDWQIHSYGGTVHAFTNPMANDPAFGTVYKESSDLRSWQSMQNFLNEIFH